MVQPVHIAAALVHGRDVEGERRLAHGVRGARRVGHRGRRLPVVAAPEQQRLVEVSPTPEQACPEGDHHIPSH
ncbi:MAG: hypothetical protein ACK559_06465, partial [bacterium]